jgi:hypothetical protein
MIGKAGAGIGAGIGPGQITIFAENGLADAQFKHEPNGTIVLGTPPQDVNENGCMFPLESSEYELNAPGHTVIPLHPTVTGVVLTKALHPVPEYI